MTTDPNAPVSANAVEVEATQEIKEWEAAYQRFRETEQDLLRLRASSTRMLNALEALESWDESLGSRSISSELWLARDELKRELSG